MKVILVSAVSGLGNVGDVVEVKDGYGRNFLIPNKKAIVFNNNNNKLFEEKRKFFEEENKKNIEIANSLRKSIGSANIVITENASDDGRLYGSVNSSTISEKINSIVKDNIVSRSHILLQNPIKEIGVYQSIVSLHPDAEFAITLVVCRNESEVESLLKSYKESKNKQQSDVEEKPKAKKEAKKESSDQQENVVSEVQEDAKEESDKESA